ncbi:hypothetical protein B0H21DRAFT_818303 [Amylocystis lapponica]|nr:hypothetical protein B0H21DRAFT_818303 [Amylocystis lapponica]
MIQHRPDDATVYLNFSTPQLERFTMRLTGGSSQSHATFLVLFQGHAPRLKILALQGHVGHWLPSNQFDNLVHLCVGEANRCQWRLSDLMMLLSRCPRLKELIVAQLGASWDSVESHTAPRIAPRHLVRLVLKNVHPEFANGLLSHLDLLAKPIALCLTGQARSDDSKELFSDPALVQALSPLDLMQYLTTLKSISSAIHMPLVRFSGSLPVWERIEDPVASGATSTVASFFVPCRK